MKPITLFSGLALAAPALAGGGITPFLSEFRLDEPSTDVNEYVEIGGAPNADLSGLWFVIIGDGTGGSGVVETAVDLTGVLTDANGFCVLARSTFTLGTANVTNDSMSFENSDNVTYMLVQGFGNAVGNDLDADESGDLEGLIGTVVDSLSIVETIGSGDLLYGSATCGPDGAFVPGAGRLCGWGWVVTPFDPLAGEDTPGAANLCVLPGDDCSGALTAAVGANAFDTTGLTDSGFHDGSCVSRNGFIDIWFSYTAAVDGVHTVDTCGSGFDTVLRVLDGACGATTCLAGNDDACATTLGNNFASAVTATLTSGTTYLIQVEGWGSSDAGAGLLNIAEPSSVVPGDLCADAIVASSGLNTFDTTGLTNSGFHDGSCVGQDGQIDIWFSYTANVTGTHSFDTCGSAFDTVLRVLDGDCSASTCLAGSDDACYMTGSSNAWASALTADLVAGTTYLVHVEGWGGGDQGAGNLLIFEPDACTAGGDDWISSTFGNNSCASALGISNIVLQDMTVCKSRADFYGFTVANGETVSIQAQFLTANGDIDAFLYDAGACINNDGSDPGCTGSLECGYSGTNNETLSWTNSTGAGVAVTLRISLWPFTASDSNSYDLVIGGLAETGMTSFCAPANANSTGNAVTLNASSGAYGAVLLNAVGGGAGEFGYFLVSATGIDPGIAVADGMLCLGAPIGRYNSNAGNLNPARNSVGTFADAGTGGLTVFESPNPGFGTEGFIVPAQLPYMGGNFPGANIQPGETWNFQLWYRDVASSNFSDAMAITF